MYECPVDAEGEKFESVVGVLYRLRVGCDWPAADGCPSGPVLRRRYLPVVPDLVVGAVYEHLQPARAVEGDERGSVWWE